MARKKRANPPPPESPPAPENPPPRIVEGAATATGKGAAAAQGGLTGEGPGTLVLQRPNPRNFPRASEEQVHDAIAADPRPVWNLGDIRKPTQDRLIAQGLYAPQPLIERLAGDERHAHRRGPAGPRRK
jgi:hypothetical protein